MATKCVCDKCGKVIINHFDSEVLKIKRHFEVSDQIWEDYQSYDLCENCLKKIDDYLQEK